MESNVWRTCAGAARAAVVALSIVTSHWTAAAQERTPQEEVKAEPRVIERGAHHRVVQTVTRRVTPFGREYFVTNSYTELRTGMHYSDNGEWKESNTRIEVFPEGAIARQGAHQVIWSPNLNVQGAVDLLTPDGKRFRSHILGLAYTDAVSGRSVLIAEPKDSIGEVVGNQVIYRDAFAGPFRADVRYTYTESGISQDILIREVLPSPSAYDLSDERSRIEVWTEFVEASDPVKGRSVLKAEADAEARQAMVDPDMTDETLDFGAMRIGSGSAFPLDAPASDDEFNSESAPVGKNWIQLEGRTFLIEKTDLRDIREKINQLPKSASVNRTKEQRQAAVRKGSSRERLLASLPTLERREAKAGNGTMRTALVMPPEKGFVLDYSMVSSATNFTFKSDTTYFISGNVTLSGTTVVESAVIKYTNGNSTARLIVQGPVICRTDSHRPVIFTSKDDDTVGEIIAGSTNNPSTTNYGYFFDIAGNTNVIDLNNVRMRRAYFAINLNASSKLILRNAQLSSNYAGVVIAGGEARLRNVLIHDGRYAYGSTGTNNHAEHVTFHRLELLRSGVTLSNYNTYLTNSMVIAVTNFMIYTGVNIASNASDAGIFQTVGQGQRYLATGSTNRNVGTTNINSDLLTALKTRTTYPPTVLANLNASTNLAPVVERDVSQPDLGYHYDVLDFLVGGVSMTNVTLTVTNGATIGLDASQTNYGIRLGSGATIVSEGSATNFNRFVRSLLVQEVPTGNAGVQTPLFADTVPIPANATTFKARFTDFPASPNSYLFNQSWGNGTLINLHLRDSYIRGGRITFFPSSSNCVVTLTNCLLDRVNLFIYEYAQEKFHAFNNLFRGGTNYFDMRINSVWDWRNNLFDQTLLQQWIYGTFNHSHNGYVNGHSRLTPTNASDMVLTASPAYDTDAYALYYLPGSSPLINAGSTNASAVGLYHYSTGTNQLKEGSSTVDIGLHFVSLDSSGAPVDSDSDGVPDYIEDANGNGLADGSENSHANPVLTLVSTMTYIKGGPAKRFDTNAVAYDADSTTLGGATLTVTITSGGESGDRLAVRNRGTNAGQISVSGSLISYGGTVIATNSGGSGTTPLVITFNTTAVNASLEALVRNLTFQNVSNSPANSNRVVKFELADGKGGTNAPTTQTVSVTCPDSMDVMVLFDVSKSMTGVYTNGVLASNDVARYWTAKAAASNFVSLLNFGVDRVGLITFAETAALLSPLTTNAALVQSNIYAQVTNSGTILSPPLLIGRTNFTGSGSNTLRLMVILSDGEEFPYSNRTNTITAANAAKDEDIRLISIGFFTGENIYKDPSDGGTNLLKEIASSTNDFYFAPSFGEMQSNFFAAAQSLCRGHSFIQLTSPATGTAYTNPPSITLQAMASDSEGVTRVEFYQSGTSKLGEDASSPYALTWANPTPGTNSLTAVLIDGLGNATTSAPVTVIVRSSPSIALVSPTNATHFAAVMNLLVRAAATDADGFITNVVFFTNGVKAVTVTNPPFRFPWTNLNSSTNYRIHAVAWDNHGLTNTSATNTFVVEACSQVGVSSLTLSAYTVGGGSNVTATVTLVSNAPSGGQMVELSAASPDVSIPALVFVPAGTNKVTFLVDTFSSQNGGEAALTAATPVSGRTTNLVVQAAGFASARYRGQCGPMDLVFAIDRSVSSEASLAGIKAWLTNTLNAIKQTSDGDYRLGLVTFATNRVFVHTQLSQTNANEFTDAITNLTTLSGMTFEPSNEALNTILNGLSSAGRPGQTGDFTNRFRSEARKVVVMIMDEPPQNFESAGSSDLAGSHVRAIQAFHAGIQVCTLVLPSINQAGDPDYIEDTIAAADDLAYTTGGVSYLINPPPGYTYVGDPLPTQPIDLQIAIETVIARCGADLGEVVVIRDDLRPQSHATISLNSSVQTGLALDAATFDLSGIDGLLEAAHLSRAGQLRVNFGSRFDLGLGVASLLDTNLQSFALPTRSTNLTSQALTYTTNWHLPFSFYADIQGYLGGIYPLALVDRVSSICGNNFELVDTPQHDWPSSKNVLTVKTLASFEIAQGRCRDFVLPGTNPPCGSCGASWEIRLYDEVIASECAPHGWSVESDYGVYGGVNICAPDDAVTANRYEVRYNDGASVRSGYFTVTPSGAQNTAPVLKPIELSHPLCSSNTVVTVTISLDAPAQGDGAFVAVTCSGITNVGIPAYVHISPGQRSTAFTFRPNPVADTTSFTLVANYNGERRAAGQVVAETALLVSPGELTTHVIGRQVAVSWASVSGALTYQLWRVLGHDEPVLLAGGLTRTCFVDETPLSHGTTSNCYQIVAINSYTNSDPVELCELFFQEAVLRPRILPHGGRFHDAAWVTLTCETPGATILWSTNGIPPGDFNGEVYIEPFPIVTSVRLIAKASTGTSPLNWSPEASADFFVVQPTPLGCGSNITARLATTNQPSLFKGSGHYAARYSFTGRKGDVVTISVSSTDFDPDLNLTDPLTNLVYQSGYPASLLDGFSPTLVHTLKTNGTYVVEVTSAFPFATGDFELSIDCDPSPELDVFFGSTNVVNGTSYDLGLVATGTTKQVTFVLTNSGSATLNFSSITLTPAGRFTHNQPSLTTLATNSAVSLTVTFHATNTGPVTGTLTLVNDDEFDDTPEGEYEFDDPFVLTFTAFVNPPGTPPTVGITNIANGQIVVSPPTLTIGATATATASSITQVLFQATGPSGVIPLGVDVSGPPWSVSWPNAPGGSYTLRAIAMDDGGRMALSAPTNIVVNTPPLVVKDRHSVFINSTSNLIEIVANDSDPNGHALTLTNYFFNGPSHGTVSKSGNAVLYTPTASYSGFDSFSYYVYDALGAMGTGTVSVAVIPQFGWGADPVSVISSPSNGVEIAEATVITGTASHQFLQFWDLQWRRRGSAPTPWTTFAEGYDAITNGTLATFDPTGLANGIYQIKLKVSAWTDVAAETMITIRIGESAKVGHFTLAFTDLQIPVSGLPITLTRSYDSRNTTSGDFGAGWNLDVSSVRLEKSGVMGQGWEAVVGSGFQGFQTCVYETEPHLVSITFPDDKVYRFAAAVNLNNSGSPCTVSGGMSGAEGLITYTPLSGTLGTLRELGSNTLLKVGFIDTNHPVTFHDARESWSEISDTNFFGAIYDPREFEFTTLDGRKFQFNGAGKVTKMWDRAGNSLTFRDDGVIHSSGKSVKFVRDATGRITEIYDPNGLDTNGLPTGPAALSYKYDSAGNLVHVHRLTTRNATDPKYVTTQFGYEHTRYPHYITSIVDPRGVTGIRNEYGDDGKLKSMTDASGKTIHYIHSVSNKTEIIVDRLGRTNCFVYDVKGNVTASTNALGHVNTYVFDANNNKTREVIAGLLTNTFNFDGNNLLTESVVGGLITNKFTYNQFGQVLAALDGLGRGTTNFYDSLGNLLATTNALGFTNGFTYDGAGNLLTLKDALGVLTSHLYDEYGNLTNVVTSKGSLSVTNTYTYDENGNRLTERTWRTQPNGQMQELLTTLLYDAQNRVIATVNASSQTNQTVLNEIGRQENVIDVLGRTNRYEYDLQGHLSRVTYSDGTSESYAYDAEGRRTNAVDRGGRVTASVYDALGRLTQTVYPDNTTTRMAYDPAGRVSWTVDARGYTNWFAYDAAGRRTFSTNAIGEITRNQYDLAGNLTNVTAALGLLDRTTRYTYDALNRRVQTIFEDTTTQTTLYDELGRRVGEVDQAGITNRFGYDGLGRLVAVTNAWATPSATWATYAYDENGRQTNQVDALGRKTIYELNTRGQRLRRILPGNQSEGFKRDAAGDVLAHTNFINGLIVTNLYDVRSRLLSRWHGSTQLVANAYALSGVRTQMVDASGTYVWIYDNRDRVRTNITPAGSLYYDWDANGNLTNLASSTASGVSIGYQYDALNRLTNVTDNRLGLAAKNTKYFFDAAGNLKALEYPNGDTNLWEYDHVNRLTNLVWKLNATTNAAFAYQLGTSGNRTRLDETVGSSNRVYQWSYDSLLRLKNETITGAGPTGAVAYAFDVVGNRTNRLSTLAGITNQIFAYNTNDGLTIDAYDTAGNTRTNSGNVFLYDWANRLTNAVLGTTNVAIVYNGDGQRVRKTVIVGATTNLTLYLVDEFNPTGYAQVVEEKSVVGTTTNLIKAFVYGLDLISQRIPNVTTNFYGFDGIGSTRFLLNLAGVVSDTYAYDAFGTILARTGSTTNENLFHGEFRDSHLGLDIRPARYYAANFGRWWTMDPWEGSQSEPNSLHKYLSFANSPVNRVDPSGNNSDTISFSIGSTMAGTLSSLSLPSLASVKTVAGTLAVAVAAGVSLSGSTEAAQEQLLIEVAEMTLAGAGTSMANEISKAHQIWRTRNGNLKIPKIVPVPGFLLPKVANHVAIAQLVHGPILTRDHPGQAAKNRYQVLKGRGSAGPKMSWDEYPFFSSRQGGRPNASVMAVPQEENWLQGGIIGGAYLLEKIQPGDDYIVIVTP